MNLREPVSRQPESCEGKYPLSRAETCKALHSALRDMSRTLIEMLDALRHLAWQRCI